MKFALTSFLAILSTNCLADGAGVKMLDIDMPHHGRVASATVWYPANDDAATSLFAENPVFHGVEVAKDAKAAGSDLPIVLFSHGMGGTFRAQAWLAAGLAERGAVVLAVNHPNGTWGDFDMRYGVDHWTRAQDLSAALDQLLQSSDFAGLVDPKRIMAAGFSFGGWTAMSLGGMTGNLSGITAACQANIDSMSACEVLLSETVNMQGKDPQVWNASYADERITHVAAIDPGFVWGLTPENVAGLKQETLIVGFGVGENRMQATDFDASGLAAMLPDAHIVQIDPAAHFSAMPLCKPAGAEILVNEQDDPVCTDPDGADRAVIHNQIIDLMAGHLGL